MKKATSVVLVFGIPALITFAATFVIIDQRPAPIEQAVTNAKGSVALGERDVFLTTTGIPVDGLSVTNQNVTREGGRTLVATDIGLMCARDLVKPTWK